MKLLSLFPYAILCALTPLFSLAPPADTSIPHLEKRGLDWGRIDLIARSAGHHHSGDENSACQAHRCLTQPQPHQGSPSARLAFK